VSAQIENEEGESLVTPGYFGASPDRIIYEENFVELDDLKYIQKFVGTINEWNNPLPDTFNDDGDCIYEANYWWNRVCSGDIIEKLDITAFKIVDKYIQKMARLIEDTHRVTVYERPPVIVRWTPGTEQSPHSDKQLNDGRPNPFPLYDINSIIYWNDDFEGGEFYYPEYELEFKIKAGMAVAHPGDIHYLHGVRQVISGVRWTTPSFYTITGFKEN
jgi:hypothetical protein